MPDVLVSQDIPSLIGGVSRQPAPQRNPAQSETQVNFISDAAKGLVRRPPTEHVAQLAGSVATIPSEGVAAHVIDRGDGRTFMAFVTDGDVNVYDLDDGAEITVNDGATGSPGSWDYLDFSTADVTAKKNFEIVTVADYTFIVNKSVTTALTTTPSAGRTQAHEFLLFFKNVGDATQSAVDHSIDGVNIGTTTGVTTTSGNCENLMNALCGATSGTDVTGTGSYTNWKFTRIETVLYGYQFTGTLEAIDFNDSFGNTTFTHVTTGTNGSVPAVSKFSDLPAKGIDGFVVQVKGSDGSDDGQFYVAYDEEKHVWQETVLPGLYNTIDDDTMPHALVYDTSLNTFTFQSLSWDSRTVGDLDTSPIPSFIGSAIKDVSVHKNRLHLVAGENVIGSEAGNLFNFWPISATILSDSDPYDIAGTADRVSDFEYMVPFRGNLTLLSPTGNTISELKGSTDGPTTVKNARVEERGVWPNSFVHPVSVEDAVYFAQDHGGHTAISQYIQSDVDVFQADEITAWVDDYLPPNVIQMSAGTGENFVTCISNQTGHVNRIYIYRFHNVGREQVMQSWSYWEFPSGSVVHHIEWSESVAWVVLEQPDGSVHIEKMNFGASDEDNAAFTSNLGYRVYLDSLVSLTGTYDVGTDITTWTMPYPQATIGGTYNIVRGGAWGTSRGTLITVNDASVDLTVNAIGDYSAYPVYIGRQFLSTYELSTITLRGGGTANSARGARIGGRLQLRRARALYEGTGTFDVVTLSNDDDDEYRQTFTSQFLNEATFGATQLDDGVFDFAIGGDAENVRLVFEADSFLPAGISLISWEGRYFARATSA